MVLKLRNDNAEDVVKRMVFLAYQACGGAVGMGMLQEMRLGGKDAEEEQVWKCAYNEEDYPGLRRTRPNSVRCDYVFGRMMKWGCEWEKDAVKFNDRTFTRDYQSFCGTFPDNKSLAEAALKSLAIKEFTWAQ